MGLWRSGTNNNTVDKQGHVRGYDFSRTPVHSHINLTSSLSFVAAPLSYVHGRRPEVQEGVGGALLNV